MYTYIYIGSGYVKLVLSSLPHVYAPQTIRLDTRESVCVCVCVYICEHM